MYELKKNGKVFTSKFVGTRPSSLKKKKNLPGRGLIKIEKHCFKHQQGYWEHSVYFAFWLMFEAVNQKQQTWCVPNSLYVNFIAFHAQLFFRRESVFSNCHALPWGHDWKDLCVELWKQMWQQNKFHMFLYRSDGFGQMHVSPYLCACIG